MIRPFASDAASSRMVPNAVTQLNQTILEAFDGVQLQGHVAVTPRDQWNAIPDEHRDHTDDELVDRALVEEGGDEPASAHQPDVLAGLFRRRLTNGPISPLANPTPRGAAAGGPGRGEAEDRLFAS